MNLNKLKDKYSDSQYSLITFSDFEYESLVLNGEMLSISTSGKEKKNLFDLNLMKTNKSEYKDGEVCFNSGEFSRQYRFWKQRKSLKKWIKKSDNPFHLNLEVILGLFISYFVSTNEVFLDSRVLDSINKKFERRVVYQFTSYFQDKLDIRLNLVGKPKHSIFSKIGYIEGYNELLNLVDINFENEVPMSLGVEDNSYDIFENKNVLYDFENMESCAIIGNSDSILEKKYGSLINNHDTVVRLNNAKVQKYKKNVGNKTDFRFVNNVLAKDVLDKGWIDEVQNSRLIFNISEKHEKVEVTKRAVNKNQIYFLSEALNREFEKFKVSHGIQKKFLLSTGIQSILFFNIFSDSMSLFGFDFYMSDNFSHYWENEESDFQNNITHDWKREKSIVDRLSSNEENFIIYD